MGEIYEQVLEATRAVEALGGPRPRVAVILGSGLGAFAEELTDPVAAEYADLPHFASSTVQGHKGRLVLGLCGGTPVVVMQGRVHGYEGHPASAVVHGVRVMRQLGAQVLVVTNAAGGIHPDMKPGDLMRITDHINLSGINPLRGVNEEEFGPRFPDLSNAYDPELSDLLEEVAADNRLQLRRGVYACMPGPAYETPAEVRMARVMGADAVGMSTAPEVIAAVHGGVRCVGISVITNLAAGISATPLSHDEVKQVADRVTGRFIGLLTQFIPAADRRLGD